MLIFRYDKTFEGLLTAIFDAYSIKRFPDVLLAAEETSLYFMMKSSQSLRMGKK